MGSPNMFPLGISWNIDWESYSNSLPLGSGIDFTDKRLIQPFLEAVEERQRALGIFAGHIAIQSGCRCLRNTVNALPNPANISVTNDALSSGITIGVPAQTPLLQGNFWPSLSVDEVSDFYIDTNGKTQSIFTVASGISWSELQQYIAGLAQYFVKAYDNIGNPINYDGVSFIIPSGETGYDTQYPNPPDFPARTDGVSNPSGVLGLVPSLNSYQVSGYIYPNPHTNGGYTNESYIGAWNYITSFINNPSYNPSGSRALPLDYFSYINYPHGAKSIFAIAPTLIDAFPSPSGFRRKFPHEIWSTACSGNPGEIARFVFASGYYEGGDPNSEDHNTNVRNQLPQPLWPANWWGDPFGSGFNQLVLTPHSERSFSNKIMIYSTSGWVLHSDQLAQPDTITRYGLACPGDYMGPWFLNDLRDALNQMVWTACGTPLVQLHTTSPVEVWYQRYWTQVPTISNLHFSCIDLNGNINNNVPYFGKSIRVSFGYDNAGHGNVLVDGVNGLASGDPCLSLVDLNNPTASQIESYIACRWGQPYKNPDNSINQYHVYDGTNCPYHPSILIGASIYTSSVLEPFLMTWAEKDDGIGTSFTPAQGGGTRYTRSIGRSFMYVRPSGANWMDNGLQASGISRQYDFYIVDTPVSQGDSEIEDPGRGWNIVPNNPYTSGIPATNIPSILDGYGDKIGNVNPSTIGFYGNQIGGFGAFYQGTAMQDLLITTKLVGSVSGINEDMKTGILIGDKDLAQPAWPGSDSIHGYKLLDMFALAKWDIPSGFVYTRYA